MQWKIIGVAALGLALGACSGENGPGVADSASVAATKDAAPADAAAASVEAVTEAFFEAQMELNPIFATFFGEHKYNDRVANSIGPEHIAASKALEQEYLEKIDVIDSSLLSGQALLSWQIFRRDRVEALEGFAYPSHLIPVNQFFSMPNFFAMMGSGQNVQPFKTVKDYDNWLGRVSGMAVWYDQAIANMREGVRSGVVQPRVLMEKVLPQLAAHLVDDPEQSLFWQPIANMPEEFSAEDRERLTTAYRTAISSTVVPAYRRLHDYIKDEYLPDTRETVGLNALPNGDAWYAFLVRQTTTTDLTPEQIHRIGLAEVERIHKEMQGVMDAVGFEGDRRAFFDFVNEDKQFYFDDREDLLDGYRALRDDVHAKALKLFEEFPDADYEVRAVEEFREQSASGASYQRAAPDGSRPGVFYVNTYDLSARPSWAMESLFLHEAVPGHHFQIALQQEIEGLPRFRRFGGYTAYIEGWGLYAESLGKELGVYQDPYQYFGALSAELWRAIRLVVDTGLHHKGWTREQVLDYMYANAAVKEARAVSEAERFIAIPSQALAYKVGQLRIAQLRERAESALGNKFDVRAFHAQVLGDGALPLGVLESKIDRWIATLH